MKKKTGPPKPTQAPSFWRRHRRLRLWLIAVPAGLVTIALLAFIAFQVSPWPSGLLVRMVFTKNNQTMLAKLEKHTTATPITTLANQAYKPGDKNALLDVYIPQAAEQNGQALPVVIWTHGGAWVSGDKSDDEPYFKLMASHGLVVVSLNYSLAPEKTYPTQLRELNNAHAYILANAARFHIDPQKIFLAGDSAGSQLSSQMAALITSPQYAREVGIQPVLAPAQLSGVILFCGIYKMQGLTEADPKLPKIINWGDDQVVWAFSGSPDKTGPLIHQMSPYYHVTSSFPPAFISGGNGDPLTNGQSKPLAEQLAALHVPVTTLFYPADHQPSLPHEYQFDLDTSDGQNALNQMIQFIEQRSS
jgi:acetyl esterase/lipase